MRAGALISGDVIAEETVAGLGGPEHPCISEAGTTEALLLLASLALTGLLAAATTSLAAAVRAERRQCAPR